MIAPTSRAILLACVGAPLSVLLAAVLSASLWPVGAAWALAVCALVAIDGLLAASPRRVRITMGAPAMAPIGGGPFQSRLHVVYSGSVPASADLALETNEFIAAPVTQRAIVKDHRAEAAISVTPVRRGEAVVTNAHCRWMGPMGLAWRHLVAPLNTTIAITPDLGAVERHAAVLFSRTMMHGIKPLSDRGDGSEFDSMTEFQPGMDPRTVEWKQSARHVKLLAKEVRAERNHQLAFAIDTGRAMCEPVAGAPRVDWSINAALILAYVALKLGDRVSFFGFDSRPNLSTGFVTGTRAFSLLQAQTAKLNYSAEETNFTLSLATLAERLQRRSMVIVFTDFTDTVSAELMVENIARLARRHLIVFVTLPDEELETMRDSEPRASDDVGRAVIAYRLLQERNVVLTKLQRLGVKIVNAPVDRLGPALVRAYDDLRRQERV